MEVSRSELAALIDQMMSVGGGDQVPADADRPVLVIDGRGGSGRSEFLRDRWRQWARHTPTVWVDPRLLGDPDADDMSPILQAVMLGLSTKVPYYKVKFSRVILAHIAMQEPVLAGNPQNAVASMLERLAAYQDRNKLISLVGSMVRAVGKAVRAVQTPGGEVVEALSDEAASNVVDGLRRSPRVAKRTWGDALDWFGHQDIGRQWDPCVALVLLNQQAQIGTYAARRDVDELLARALLTDLRDSLGGMKNRQWNALILLDNGDMPMASAFTSALVRTRNRVPTPSSPGARGKPLDPVVVATASSGALAAQLPGPDNDASGGDGSQSGGGTVPDMRQAGTWQRFRLADFTEAEVDSMVKQRMWAFRQGTDTVTHLIHRLTGGHAVATGLVLQELDVDARQIDDAGKIDLGKVLRSTDLIPPDRNDQRPPTVSEHLLDMIVAGLRPSGRVDRWLKDDLVTLSAARNQAEAERLACLVREPNLTLLCTSTTLWSDRGRTLPPLPQPVPAPPVLPPLVKYLALRALASRDGAGTPTWETAFEALRDAADAADDHTGRLHHELALGKTELVVAELVKDLPNPCDEAWLVRLDEVTSTPDPRTVLTVQDASQHSTDRADLVARIVEGQRAAADPQLSDPAVLGDLYQRLSNDFKALAGTTSGVLTIRARFYGDLAERLGCGSGRPYRTN